MHLCDVRHGETRPGGCAGYGYLGKHGWRRRGQIQIVAFRLERQRQRETRALAQGGGGREGVGRAPKEGRRITPAKVLRLGCRVAVLMDGFSANAL